MILIKRERHWRIRLRKHYHPGSRVYKLTNNQAAEFDPPNEFINDEIKDFSSF